jgi:hypothetical protein
MPPPLLSAVPPSSPRTGEGSALRAACVRLKLNVFVACKKIRAQDA